MSNRAERRRAAKDAKKKVSLDEAIRLAKQEAGRVLRQGQAEQESRDLENLNVLWWSAVWVLHNEYGWHAKRLNAFQVHWTKLLHIMADLTRDQNREDRVTPENIIDQLTDECRDKLLPIQEIERLAGITKDDK